VLMEESPEEVNERLGEWSTAFDGKGRKVPK